MSTNAFSPQTPPIFCPLPAAPYPPSEDLMHACAKWLGRLSPGRSPEETTLHAAIGAGISVLFFPEAPPERLLSMSKYSAWSFQLDDMIDSGRLGSASQTAPVLLALARIMEAPHAHLLGDMPLAAAIADVSKDLRSWATPVQMARFTASFRLWMTGVVWELSMRERGEPVSVNEYLAVRVLATGSPNAIDMALMCAGLELPEHQMADPTLVAAREAAMAAAALDNDRYSRAKEDHGDEATLDIFDVILQHNPHHTFEEAVTEAVALRDRIMACYLKLSAQLRQNANEGLLGYLHAIDLLITGNLDMGATHARYLTPNSPAADFPRTDKPSDPDPSPVPVPTFAWWWNHLTP
ncbi:terpene synthase family protein [Streptomyces sp. C]|uniref:terpene synthase family protein n=1 Tax=Streptomyces sp. C TaxID=253839 RepID=UPI0001B5092B|nr:terpene synthase family protein [Streptomyces sp. C]EFL20029.1 predicted protein [Streptomyces sp. C]